jgi:hypothetical protein
VGRRGRDRGARRGAGQGGDGESAFGVLTRSASSTGAPAKHELAQEHLTTATTMYRAMDMRFWPEKADAEMREL